MFHLGVAGGQHRPHSVGECRAVGGRTSSRRYLAGRSRTHRRTSCRVDFAGSLPTPSRAPAVAHCHDLEMLLRRIAGDHVGQRRLVDRPPERGSPGQPRGRALGNQIHAISMPLPLRRDWHLERIFNSQFKPPRRRAPEGWATSLPEIPLTRRGFLAASLLGGAGIGGLQPRPPPRWGLGAEAITTQPKRPAPHRKRPSPPAGTRAWRTSTSAAPGPHPGVQQSTSRSADPRERRRRARHHRG